MRVCLDTNVIVAALATRGLCADVFRVVIAEHDLVIGSVILDELRRALGERLRLPAERVAAVETIFEGFALVPKPERPAEITLRDASDRWIIATALLGAADVLVTGDKDLLEIEGPAPLPIVTPRRFWEMLRKAPG